MKSAVSGIIIAGALLPTLSLAKGGSKTTDIPHCVNSCMVDATRKRGCVPYYEKCFCGKEYEDLFKACALTECAEKDLDEAIVAGFGRCNATVGVTYRSTSMPSETPSTAAPATVTPSIPHHVPCKVKHPVVVVTKTITTPSSSSSPSSPSTAPNTPSPSTTAETTGTSDTTVPAATSSTAAIATDSGAEMAYVGSLGLLSIATLLFLL